MKIFRHVVVYISILLLTGCGTGLKDFSRPDAGKIQVGHSTRQDVVSVMRAEPSRVGKKTINNVMVNQMEYSYTGSNNNSDVQETGYIPVRTQYFYLNDSNVVIGAEYHSSFDTDSTRYDVSKVPLIVKGVTTHDQIVALLGAPSIEWVKPLSSGSAVQSIGYHYRNLRISPKFMTNAYKLIVDLDVQNVVTNVDFDSKKER